MKKKKRSRASKNPAVGANNKSKGEERALKNLVDGFKSISVKVALAAATQQPVGAQVVGNAFVQQYYHILHHSPELVFRFYQDISKVGRPEEDGTMSITTTMQGINEKILSLNYSELSAEIKSVDAQESFSGGVQVLVTGHLTGKNLIRYFSQVFFLAPQDRGYFVLNDMFRYIENVNHQDGIQGSVVNDVVVPVTPEQSFVIEMKKKKRSRASKNPAVGADNKSKGEERPLKNLLDGFESISVKEAPSPQKEAKVEAVEIWGNSLADDSATEDQSSTCSISSGNLASGSSFTVGYSSSTASSSDGLVADFPPQWYRNKNAKPKKIVAVTGTVSTVLGKAYVNSALKKSSNKGKRINQESENREDMEQLLFSMLGVVSELDMSVVRDVLGQCGNDVDRALNVLLESSSSLTEQSLNSPSDAFSQEEARSSLEASGSLADGTSDTASHYSESEFTDSLWYTGHLSRTTSKGPTPEVHSSRQGCLELQLAQEVLESLFNMPTPKSAEREPSSMNWRNIVKKMTSFGHRSEICARDGAAVKYSPAAGDEYQVYREAAKQHWESMKFCYQKASTAFSNGERDYAAYMSEQGRLHNKRGQEADEKASQDIFKERNKTIENVITIDLHGQHVKQAMKLLKLHLLFGAYVQSVRAFRVITGCGSHGVGKSRVKQSAINLLKKEGIRWREENRGVLLIWLDEQTEFSFLNSDSDIE